MTEAEARWQSSMEKRCVFCNLGLPDPVFMTVADARGLTAYSATTRTDDANTFASKDQARAQEKDNVVTRLAEGIAVVFPRKLT
jgi:hypothetical protein